MHVLAGDSEQPAGFAAAEIAIPAGFPGPVPHAHDAFDEAIYVLEGRLLVSGDGEPAEAAPGSMLTAPRGHRHGFSNPYDSPALVLGIWAPSGPALAFDARDVYARHASRAAALAEYVRHRGVREVVRLGDRQASDGAVVGVQAQA